MLSIAPKSPKGDIQIITYLRSPPLGGRGHKSLLRHPPVFSINKYYCEFIIYSVHPLRYS